MRGTRAYQRYEIRKQNQEDLSLAALVLWMWVDVKIMRPRPIPNLLQEKFL